MQLWCNWLTFLPSKQTLRVRLPLVALRNFPLNIIGVSPKRLRHRTLTPAFGGSNPLTPAYALVAQMVEQRTENPRVTGSIPVLGTSESIFAL